ncbi:unnamed protein product [Laminaria digitata]
MEVVNDRKRSRWEIDGNQPSQLIDYDPVKGEVSSSVMVTPIEGHPYTSSSLAIRRYHNTNIVGTTANETFQPLPPTGIPVADERHSGEPIKTEMELAVIF